MTSRSKKLLAVTGALFALLTVSAFALPGLVRSHVNDGLVHMPDGYRGSVEAVSLHPLQLAVDLEGFRIVKADGSVQTPFLTAEILRVRLVRGSERSAELELTLYRPRASWIDADDPARRQFGPPVDLADLKRQLGLPLRRARIVEGELHLRNYSARPQVDVYASHVDATFDALTDCLPPAGICHARLDVRARPMGQATLAAHGKLDHERAFRFVLEGALQHLQLPALNAALLHYADVDVSRGKLTVDGSYHLEGDTYRAAFRPFLQDVEVLKGSHPDRNLLRELGAGLAAHYVERRDGRAVIKLSGTSGRDDLDVDLDVDRSR